MPVHKTLRILFYWHEKPFLCVKALNIFTWSSLADVIHHRKNSSMCMNVCLMCIKRGPVDRNDFLAYIKPCQKFEKFEVLSLLLLNDIFLPEMHAKHSILHHACAGFFLLASKSCKKSKAVWNKKYSLEGIRIEIFDMKIGTAWIWKRDF